VTPLPEKTCAVCGRRITWRLKWARDWDAVRYCSERCRGARSRVGERSRIETAVLDLLNARSAEATICPSDVARALVPDDWRPWMEPVREAGRRLAAAGLLEWTQQGRPVDPATARGPVRFRRPRR
jgi:hypothetical protein